ncbi:hypothetical protein [Flavobacterium sp.]|uniref:hypothetical protein n=1 Tax=Flavobacterium sp. TaxID=239 RepID=UPI0026139CAC|nr:hypothetical protein [Flavobacterium sp.]
MRQIQEKEQQLIILSQLCEAVNVLIEHLIGEKAFANAITFIEIEQWEGEEENQIELYYLKSYIDAEIKN